MRPGAGSRPRLGESESPHGERARELAARRYCPTLAVEFARLRCIVCKSTPLHRDPSTAFANSLGSWPGLNRRRIRPMDSMVGHPRASRPRRDFPSVDALGSSFACLEYLEDHVGHLQAMPCVTSVCVFLPAPFASVDEVLACQFIQAPGECKCWRHRLPTRDSR